MQTLDDFVGALRPFLRDDAVITVEKVYHHHFVSIVDTEARLCFSADCDDEENSWIEFKHYLLTET